MYTLGYIVFILIIYQHIPCKLIPNLYIFHKSKPSGCSENSSCPTLKNNDNFKECKEELNINNIQGWPDLYENGVKKIRIISQIKESNSVKECVGVACHNQGLENFPRLVSNGPCWITSYEIKIKS